MMMIIVVGRLGDVDGHRAVVGRAGGQKR